MFIFLCVSSTGNSAESEILSFSSKNYFFQTDLKKSKIEVIWNKSGFKYRLSKKMNSCFEKSIRKEITELGKMLLSIRGKHDVGVEADVKWKNWKDKRKFYPREMDKLDKRISFIYSLAKNSESKCIK